MTGAIRPNGHDRPTERSRKCAPLDHDEHVGAGRGASGRMLTMPITESLWDWTSVRISEPDFLVRNLLSTSTRALFVGASGIGKTNFCLALAVAMSQGRDFMHWSATRPGKILYVDGEMGPALAKRRIEDVARRMGKIEYPDNFRFVCLNQLPERPPPLNTENGQLYFNALINRYNPGATTDFIFLDNIQSLLAGKMTDEESWSEIMPWFQSLTRCHVGQFWIHHSVRDGTRAYGTVTREWQMDLVMLAEATALDVDHVEFNLKFTKARERTSDNRADFEPRIISLVDDEWHSDTVVAQSTKRKPAALPARRTRVLPVAEKYHSALIDALAHCGEPRSEAAGLPSVTSGQWQGELHRLGLLRDGSERTAGNANRARISKYRAELIAAGWMAANGPVVWSIRRP